MDNTTLVLAIIGVAMVLGIGVLVYWRRGSRIDDSFYHFRCPKCKRRLRYQTRQVGHKGKCSNCASEVIFPPTAQSID